MLIGGRFSPLGIVAMYVAHGFAQLYISFNIAHDANGVHYPALTEIVRATAAEFGLTYRENRTVTGAFLAHLRWLKLLGRVDDPTLVADAAVG